jgi:hypothetical protein
MLEWTGKVSKKREKVAECLRHKKAAEKKVLPAAFE